MSLAALRDAIDLLISRPVLWLHGVACGCFAALLGVILWYGGTFYAARLLVFLFLAAVFLVTGIYIVIRQDGDNLGAILKGSAGYFFRVLTPTLVIAFGIVLVFSLVVLTLALFGMQPDPGLLTFLTFGVVFPTLMLTFFYDTAAVLEDRKVFESLQRSIEVVTANLFSVIIFYIGCFCLFCAILFAVFMAWTIALADKLEPLTQYNETQIAALTPDQMVSLIANLIGPDGLWVTVVCVFASVTILLPVLYTYKACFYRMISGTTLPIEQTIGEYDSKGRWYKY
jgi:uncharacterized membrane protein